MLGEDIRAGHGVKVEMGTQSEEPEARLLGQSGITGREKVPQSAG